MSLCQSITETIGRTPLLELKGLEKELGLTAQIFAKLECFNPGGSIKDRAALSMIKTAQAEGKLLPGGSSWSRPAATPASVLRWWHEPWVFAPFLPCPNQ